MSLQITVGFDNMVQMVLESIKQKLEEKDKEDGVKQYRDFSYKIIRECKGGQEHIRLEVEVSVSNTEELTD